MTATVRLGPTAMRLAAQGHIRARGYAVLYRPGLHCPGCGRSHWHVGRVTAECAFCATALPLAPQNEGQN